MQNRTQKQIVTNLQYLFVYKTLPHIEYGENISICNNGYKAMDKRIKKTTM